MTDPDWADLAQNVFPGNVIAVLETVFTDPMIQLVVRRPLNKLDPSFSLGVIAVDWEPGGIEIKGSPAGAGFTIGAQEPTLSTYVYAVQTLIRHGDPSDGLAQSSYLNKYVRTMLYRDPGVRVALARLSETSLGVHERFQRWTVGRQRFASNEIEAEWLYLATTEIKVETETVPA